MSISRHRLALFFYNVASISSLKYKNGKYSVSTFLAILNLFKAPGCIMLMSVMLSIPWLAETIFLAPSTLFGNLSTFSIVAIVIEVTTINVSIVVLAWIHFYQRKLIENLANACLEKRLSVRYFEKFQNFCKERSLVLFSVLTAMFVLNFLGAFKVSIISLLVSLIIVYPILVLFSFISLLNNFENFIVASLKEFKSELRMFSCSSIIRNRKNNFEASVKLCQSFQEIHLLIEDFNEALGKQVTVLVCSLLLTSIFHVSFILILSSRAFN